MDELQNQQNQNQPQWQQPQEPQIKENTNNKKIIIIVVMIVALLLIGLGVWGWQQKKYRDKYGLPGQLVEPVATEIQKQIPQDTTSAINNELDSIGIESIDDSFKEIDVDLNSL